MISEFCIRRPVATLLMSFALVLGGLFAYKFLPVAALPSAEFPVVNVSASLPGASPETMATSVATPLIKQFATIAGIDSISTTNSLGQTSIAIQFVLNRDIDAAAADVQAAIARTQKSLPPQMTAPPSYRKVNPADAPILLMSLVSDTVPLTDLDAFAENVISPSLSTIDGVAQVSIFGQQKYAVRIQIDPTALAARGISIDQLQAAVASANSNTPLGVLQNNKQQLTITANTQLTDAAGFSNIIIATKNGHPVRLGEVTRVVDSVQTTTTASWYDGTRAIIMAVQRQPDANTVDVVDKVKAMLPSFQDQMPAAAEHQAAQRPLDLDPPGRQRRAVHAAAHHRPGDAGDLRVPAPGHGDHHPGRGGADLADRHAWRDVPVRLFHRQHIADGPDARRRPRRRRRHRHAGEHLPPYGGGRDCRPSTRR